MHLIFLLLHLPGFPQVFGYHELHCHCCLVGGWFLFQDQPFVSLIPKLMSCSFFGRILWRVEKFGHSKKLMVFWIFMDPLLPWRILELNPNHQLTIPPWNPNDLYFWRSTPQNKALSNQNKGHLGSRTTKFTKWISPQYPESSNMGNPGWSPEMMRFQVRGVGFHTIFVGFLCKRRSLIFGAAFWQRRRKLNPGKKIGHLFVTLIADI